MSGGQETEQPKRVPGNVSDDDLLPLLTELRVNGRKSMRQIAEETGLPLAKVGRLLKGVEPGPDPDGGRTEKTESRQPQFMVINVRKEDAAKLLALAIDEGYSGIEEFLEKSMIPWHIVKRDFEWKLRIKIVPKQFQLYIEKVMADSIELQQLKEQWAKQLEKIQAQGTTMMPMPETIGGG